MKKRIVITLSILLVAIASVVGANYLLSFHTVSFSLNTRVTGITVYGSDDKEIKKLSSSGEITVHEGNYYVIPDGENVASNKITFSVEKSDKDIVIDPPYSKEYLSAELTKELPAINTALSAKYPTLIPNYTLKSGTLYGHGDWFGGLLAPKVNDIRDQRAPYRVVLNKKDGTWEVVRRPEYVLSASRYKEVPVDILRAINAIVELPDTQL